MTLAIIHALTAGFSLWNTKESKEYSEKLIKLEKAYWNEENKKRPDMARLDNINFELRTISKAFYSAVKKP